MKSIRDDLPRLKLVFLCTIVFGLAAHAYMYFSLAPSHDSISCLFSEGESSMLALGRFAAPLYYRIRGELPVPWLTGMLSILFLSAGVYFMVSALRIENRFSIGLLCGILATNLTLTATNATYLYASDTYMLALLMACGGVYLWERLPRWGVWLAVPCFICCMGLYQAYIDVAIGLALLLLIRYAAEGKPFSDLWRRALKYAVSLLAGAALYFICVKLTQSLSGTAMSNGRNGLAQLLGSDPASLLRLIPRAYFEFAAFFFSPLRPHNTTAVSVCLLLTAAAGVCLWVRALWRRRIRGGPLVVLLLCTALLPLGLNFVYVLSLEHMHTLMTYSYFLIWIVPLLPLDLDTMPSRETAPRPAGLGKRLILCLCAYVVFHNVVFANGAYYYKRIVYDASYEYAFSIAEQIERQPEYVPGQTPVLFIGSFAGSYAARTVNSAFEQYRRVTGLEESTTFTYEETLRGFFTGLLGHPINDVVSQPQLDELLSAPEVQSMPLFPKEGCCRLIDGVMVVRLS